VILTSVFIRQKDIDPGIAEVDDARERLEVLKSQ
jgi:hypothetical protein